MDYKLQADNYLKWVGENYTKLKAKYFKFCMEKDYEWDEDVYSQTYMKVYDCIASNGLKDDSEKGMDNYTFKAFKNNIQLEKIYARNKHRDKNVTDINGAYESWYNETHTTVREKLLKDLFVDFATLYIMHMVEQNFDKVHFHVFRTKILHGMTFKELAEHTQVKASRLKFITVQKWVKEHITKEEIKEAFYKRFDDLIEL